MKMQMILKYNTGDQETRYYNTKRECDEHFTYILRNRRDEVWCIWIRPVNITPRNKHLQERVDICRKGQKLQK